MENVSSIFDVALELNKHYSDNVEKVSKKERSDLFTNILKSLFDKYGEFLGYDDIHLFKSDVVNTKNLLKKNGSRFKRKKSKPGSNKDFWNNCVLLKEYYHPREGDGRIFVERQIEDCGLNPDSY